MQHGLGGELFPGYGDGADLEWSEFIPEGVFCHLQSSIGPKHAALMQLADFLVQTRFFHFSIQQSEQVLRAT